MSRGLLLAVIISVVLTAGVMSQSCGCDCGGKVPFDKVPNPLNCSQYYICIGDGLCSDSPLPCDSGSEFLEDGTECTPAGTPPCTSTCQTSACHLHCNGTLDVVSDPKDCSQYYVCQAGGELAGPITCPADRPVFDGVNCVTDRSKCCDSNNLCIPVCESGVVQAPDPIDCHKYYICVDGVIDESYHFECPSGEHFSTSAGHCVPGDVCENLCDMLHHVRKIFKW